jgi:hypothetical protein
MTEPVPDESHEQTPPDAPAPEPADTDALEHLEAENRDLRARVEELDRSRDERDDLARRLERARLEGERLRERHRELALAHAVDEAALGLGVAPEAARLLRGRFRCTLDDQGRPKIEPDPAELLARELGSDPLLRDSASRARRDRGAEAILDGTAEIADADPVDLMASLDRRADRKARFVRRHGTQAFLDLAAAALRKGYRS